MSSGPEQLCGPPASSERLPGEADSCPPPGRSPRLPASGMPMQDKNRRAAGSGRAESHSGGPHHRFSYTLPDRPKGSAPLQILEAHAAASAQFPGGDPLTFSPTAVCSATGPVGRRLSSWAALPTGSSAAAAEGGGLGRGACKPLTPAACPALPWTPGSGGSAGPRPQGTQGKSFWTVEL